MRNHYRRLHSAKCISFTILSLPLDRLRSDLAAVDSKPPKAMVLGQKCRDRARKEMAQLVYTQAMLGQLTGGSLQQTPRGRSVQSARGASQNVQSQVETRTLSLFRTVSFARSQQPIVLVREASNRLV
jgi:hypothetical protein